MKALTVRDPWAWCIATGAKYVENRSRVVSYRGPLAIHTAAGFAPMGAIDPRVIAEVDRWRRPSERGEPAGYLSVDLPLFKARHVVAVVDLVDCHIAAGCCAPWGDQQYGDASAAHWVLANPRRLAVPFTMTGRLGLWDVDDERIRGAIPDSPAASKVDYRVQIDGNR